MSLDGQPRTPLGDRAVEDLPSEFVNNNQNSSMEMYTAIVSPEEEVLRLRGRRSFEVNSSPVNLAKYSFSPMKKMRSPAKALHFRSPRKRLQMDDVPRVPVSPAKSAKRARLFDSLRDDSDPSLAIQSLNKRQLMSLLQKVMDNDDVKAQIANQLPEPDLEHMESKLRQNLKLVLNLNGTKQNLSPLTNFRKMHPALESFRAKLSSHVDSLIKGQQWSSGIEYVLLAWPYVRQLPEYRENVQNRTRLQCFRLLTGLLDLCMPACSNLTDAHKEVLSRRINAMKPDCPQIVLPLINSYHGVFD